MNNTQRSALIEMVNAILRVDHIDEVTRFRANRLAWKIGMVSVFA